jgi:hypothetical protein
MHKQLSSDQRDALRMLVSLRHAARVQIREHGRCLALIVNLRDAKTRAIAAGNRVLEMEARVHLESVLEAELEIKFDIIEIGETFIRLLDRFDELPRTVWLEALGCNRSEWDSERMQKCGQDILNAVTILKIENSASKGDTLVCKPLFWCIELAMFNDMDTNPNLGKAVHDMCNEAFDGVMGTWREPTLLQRLGVHHV